MKICLDSKVPCLSSRKESAAKAQATQAKGSGAGRRSATGVIEAGSVASLGDSEVSSESVLSTSGSVVSGTLVVFSDSLVVVSTFLQVVSALLVPFSQPLVKFSDLVEPDGQIDGHIFLENILEVFESHF